MEFIKANINDFDLIYSMMLRARDKLFSEKIFQWDERYPRPEMIKNDLENGYTSLVKDKGNIVAFFTSNSICEDDVHDHIFWLNNDNSWIILHRLCVEPSLQANGIGQKILELFERESKNKGFSSIRIDVFSTNQVAIHIYEKYGYTRVGEAVCERGSFYIYEKILK